MKKVLSVSILSVLLLAACNNDNLITKTYKVNGVTEEGYAATASNNEGVYIDKKDTKIDLHKDDKIKVTFTKKQYESMNGLKKVELIK